MAEDEDREIAAALAKLAEQDAAVADDARAALEWVAREPVSTPHGHAVGGDRRDRSYELTGTGQATALAALQARATGPRTVPWF
ncbi:MAG: hypothetical protein ABSB76_12625 [Streptosporangiaceae bacterium]|jgi:hypothetical protein